MLRQKNQVNRMLQQKPAPHPHPAELDDTEALSGSEAKRQESANEIHDH